MSEPTSRADDSRQDDFPKVDFSTDDSPRPAVSRDALRLESGPRWLAPAALGLALLAAIGAGVALFRPAPPTSGPGPSADPKAQVCSAFNTVSKAVSIQTKRSPGPDLGPATPIAAEAIAANARLSMAGGASYMLEQLPSNTPKQLADEVRAFATNLNGIAMNALAQIPNDKEPQMGLLKSVETSNKNIAELCK